MRSKKPQPKKNHQSPPGGFSDSQSSNKRKWLAIAAAVSFITIIVVSINLSSSSNENNTTTIASKSAASNTEFLRMPTGSGLIDAKTAAEKEQQKKQLQMRFDEVSKTFCNYRESTKYPNSSRPISQHPDQVYPNQAITETHAMRNRHGGSDKNIQIQTTSTTTTTKNWDNFINPDEQFFFLFLIFH